MPDLLVSLYALPPLERHLEPLRQSGVDIRRAIGPEKQLVCEWVTRTFLHSSWSSECEIAFARRPVSCLLALRGDGIIGFYCYEVTFKNFAGPAGVLPRERRKDIFQALTLRAMHAFRDEGYAYAIVGSTNHASFKASQAIVNARVIEGSDPGAYAPPLAIG